MDSIPLDLNADEIRIITDRIHNEDKDEGRIIAKPLLLKLGAAFIDMLLPDKKKDGTYTIYLTEAETWLIRSKINSGDRSENDTKLGINLLRKIYTALIIFDTADAMDGIPDASEGDHKFSEMLRAKHIDNPDADLADNDFLAGAA